MNSRPPAARRPPAAQRFSTSAWRNPKVLLGAALVLASAVVGATLIGAADHSQSYWSVRADVRAGERITSADLVRVRARLDGRTAATLYPVGRVPVTGAVWAHGLRAGSLVTRSAVQSASRVGQQLPVAVAAGAMPADLAPGDRVDVWVGPGPNGDAAKASSRVVSAVRVLSVGPAGSQNRTVVLALGTSPPDGAVVSALAASHVTLVRVG